MGTFVQQCINGLTIGCTYALVAVGFTLIFGVLRVVYLSHGAVLAASSYLGLYALAYSGSVLIAIATGIIGGALLGFIVEYMTVRPFRGQNHLIPMVATASVATIIQEVLRLTFQGGQPIAYPRAITSALYEWKFSEFRIYVTLGQITIALVAILLVVALNLAVKRSWMGRGIRSVADSEWVSSLLGVHVNAISAQTVALGSSLAGAAGVLLGLTVPAIDPHFGETLQFKALAITLFAGLGSVPGAVIGGIMLGLVEAFASGYLATSYRDLFAYVMMIVILSVRPAGLLGRQPAQRV